MWGEHVKYNYTNYMMRQEFDILLNITELYWTLIFIDQIVEYF